MIRKKLFTVAQRAAGSGIVATFSAPGHRPEMKDANRCRNCRSRWTDDFLLFPNNTRLLRSLCP